MPLDPEAKRVGKELRELRESVGLTLEEVAEKSGYSRRTLENVEYGRHPGSERIRRTIKEIYEKARNATQQPDWQQYDIGVSEDGEYSADQLPVANSYALHHIAWYISQPEWEPRLKHFMEISGSSREVAARYLIALELKEEKDRAEKKLQTSS